MNPIPGPNNKKKPEAPSKPAKPTGGHPQQSGTNPVKPLRPAAVAPKASPATANARQNMAEVKLGGGPKAVAASNAGIAASAGTQRRGGSADAATANAPAASAARQGRGSGTSQIVTSHVGGTDRGGKPAGYRGTASEYAQHNFDQTGMSAEQVHNTTIGRGWTLGGREVASQRAGGTNTDFSNLPGDKGYNASTAMANVGAGTHSVAGAVQSRRMTAQANAGGGAPGGGNGWQPAASAAKTPTVQAGPKVGNLGGRPAFSSASGFAQNPQKQNPFA